MKKCNGYYDAGGMFGVLYESCSFEAGCGLPGCRSWKDILARAPGPIEVFAPTDGLVHYMAPYHADLKILYVRRCDLSWNWNARPRQAVVTCVHCAKYVL